MSEEAHVRVIVRFRPLNEREKKETGTSVARVTSEDAEVRIFDEDGEAPKRFTFDHVFFEASTQGEIYDLAARETIEDVKRGYNGTIFAYGQTGSGKSFTMFGPRIGDENMRGIIPRACVDIISMVENDGAKGIHWEVVVSFLEIYNERINDLINVRNRDLQVSMGNAASGKRSTIIRGLHEERVHNINEVWELLVRGEAHRAQSATQMNAESSRSHSVFIMKLRRLNDKDPTRVEHEGRLYLVDLAGSEKLSKTGAQGTQADEAKSINLSLTSLGRCIKAIGDIQKAKEDYERKRAAHIAKKGSKAPFPAFKAEQIPFRDSQLTKILQDSLMGNTKTTLCVCCSASKFNLTETVSTLQFARRARAIRNVVKQNKSLSLDQLEALVAELQKKMEALTLENKALRASLKWFRTQTGLEAPSLTLLEKLGMVDEEAGRGVLKGGKDDSDKALSSPEENVDDNDHDVDDEDGGEGASGSATASATDTGSATDSAEPPSSTKDESNTAAELEALRAEMKDMEQTQAALVAEWMQKYGDAQSEIEALREEVTELSDKLSEAEIAAAEAASASASTSPSTGGAGAGSHADEVVTSEEVERLRGEVGRLEAALLAEQTSLTEATDALTERYKEAAADRDSARVELVAMTGERDSLALRVSALEANLEDLSEAAAEADRLRTGFSEMHAKVVKADQAAWSAEYEMKRALEAEASLTATIAALTTDKADLTTSLDAATAHVSDLMSQLSTANVAAAHLEGQLAEGRAGAATAATRVSALEARLAACVAEVKEAQDQAERDVEEALQQLDVVEARAQGHEEKIARLERELEAATSSSSQADDQRNALISSLRSELDAAGAARESLRTTLDARIEAAKRDTQRAERALAEAEAGRSRDAVALAAAESAAHDLREKVATLEGDLDNLRLTARESEKSAAAHGARSEALAARIAGLEGDLASSRDALAAALAAVERAEAADVRAECERLLAQLAANEEQMKLLRDKNKMQSGRLKEKQDELAAVSEALTGERVKASQTAAVVGQQQARIVELEALVALLNGRLTAAEAAAASAAAVGGGKTTDERVFTLEDEVNRLVAENGRLRALHAAATAAATSGGEGSGGASNSSPLASLSSSPAHLSSSLDGRRPRKAWSGSERSGSLTAMETKIDFSKLQLRFTDSEILKSAQREAWVNEAKFRKHMESLQSGVSSEVKEQMAFGF